MRRTHQRAASPAFAGSDPDNTTRPPVRRLRRAPDPTLQTTAGRSTGLLRPGEEVDLLSPPGVNIAGLGSNLNPPDTTGEVGRSHFVQIVNSTQFQVFDKAGASLLGPASLGALWPAGDDCAGNLGDPIVVYDHLADRWILSQFTSTAECIAVSQTADPTAGTWFLYRFATPNFPDYPKIGVWPDAYYMTTYESPSLGIYAFERDAMLAGNAADAVRTSIPALGAPGVRDTRVLPADLDGPPPPAGTPGLMVRTVDDQQDPGNPTDRIEVYEAAVNWGSNTITLTLAQTLAAAQGLAAFDTMTCNRAGGGIRDCIPQPDTTATVDALSNRPMMQLRFRQFSGHRTLVFNQTIDVAGALPGLPFTPAGEVAGIRWYELRRTASDWILHQQGTYAPQGAPTVENELLHRWMGSIAMDGDGNVALGYSVVNSDGDPGQQVYPGLRYVGRMSSDPLGTMPESEQVIQDGLNSQTGGGRRWGDYSQMSVDPVDDCTFYFTSHLAGAGGTGVRPTRIASFRFDGCGNRPPVARCQDVTVPVGGMCQASVSAAQVNNGSSDPDGDPLTYALAPAGPFPLGDTAVVLTVTDSGGLAASCNATVRVVDTTPPVFTAVPPARTITSCDRPDIGQAQAADECAVTLTNDAPALFPLGQTVVTWTATDAAGNQTTATQTVTAVLADDPSCCPAGSNVILGTAGHDILVGTPKIDCILGLGAGDKIIALGGNDLVSGGGGDDVILCGGGGDQVFAGPGNDVVFGGTGNDVIWGQDGDDHLMSGGGTDQLHGGAGRDRLAGGPGDDLLDGGDGVDFCVGGLGRDTYQSCEFRFF